MKNLKLFSILGALSIIIFLNSCDKSEQYAVTCRIDGQEWLSKGTVLAIVGANGLLINATSNTLYPIAISIKNYDSLGVYALDSLNNAFLYGSSLSSGYYARLAKPGIIEVTEFSAADKRVKGTFSLTAFKTNGDSVVVTDGTFNVFYQN
ncbi:MAG: DUF6252 family protein [Flavobacteriales bacterium]|nr:DUF6252 family protein [Flavobacteriales bacterium]